MEPTVYRLLTRHEKRIRVQLPYAPGHRQMLRDICGAGTRPEWDGVRKFWLVARPHYPRLLAGLADHYGYVRVVEEYDGSQKCTKICADANPDTAWECECCCLGENHGQGGAGYKEVGYYLLVAPGQVHRVEYRLHGNGRREMMS